ncbi:MAG: hypothetical protein HY778_13365, partial [Betaproteobacteria bacterium]|nr:hypothetical protein [Betaproteobacteria bacterium]
MNAAATDLDPGPLSWVRGEIDLALGRAGDSLEAWRRDPRAGADELQRARLDMRQARGALAMLCLDGVAQYASSLEQLLDTFDAAPAPDAAAVEAAQRGMAGLR